MSKKADDSVIEKVFKIFFKIVKTLYSYRFFLICRNDEIINDNDEIIIKKSVRINPLLQLLHRYIVGIQ